MSKDLTSYVEYVDGRYWRVAAQRQSTIRQGLHRAWRERHRGKPRGSAALMTELATLRAHVAELEATAVHQTPVVG